MPSDNPSGILYDPKKIERRRCFLINLFYILVLCGIAILVVRYLLLWMMPFVMAFIVAALLQTPLKWLVKITRGSKKFFSVVLVVLVVLLLAGLVAVIGWQIIVNISNFFGDKSSIHMLESTVLSITNNIQKLPAKFSSVLSQQALVSMQKSITGISSDLTGYLTTHFTSAAASVATFLATELPMLLVSFVVWVVASIFLSIDYQKVVSFLMRQVPERHTELVRTTRDLCTNTVFKLLGAYLLLMCITFAELSISFAILGIPYMFLVAALIAIVDILPVLGTGTILIPWAFISLAMGNVRMFIGIGLTYVIITVIRNILEPRLVSMQIGLNPLITLFFMFLGLKAVGIIGMLIFPVTVMILVQLQKSGQIKLWK